MSAGSFYRILWSEKRAAVGIGIDDNSLCPGDNAFIHAEGEPGLRKRFVRCCRLSQSQYEAFAASAPVIVIFNAQRLFSCCGEKLFEHVFRFVRENDHESSLQLLLKCNNNIYC